VDKGKKGRRNWDRMNKWKGMHKKLAIELPAIMKWKVYKVENGPTQLSDVCLMLPW
jgi:hypothetical protein